jgi:DNA-binding MarR family transcriptional regulator
MPARRARVPEPAPPTASPADSGDVAERIADRLHSAAIHLLRRLRREDARWGLSAPRLSALSVLVFGDGALTLGELAAVEQVKPPTMTRLVSALEAQGLVAREGDPDDGRVIRVRATAKGRSLLARGRAARVAALSAQLRALPPAQRERLADGVAILEHVITRLR